MFISDKELIKVYEKVNNRWEVAVCLNDDQVFEAISFVNAVLIQAKGGKHVDYVTNQITKKLSEFITKKKKLTIKPQFIKDNLSVFIKCTIDNPSFSSQTKEFMTTNKDKFGSECIITDKLITQISNWSLLNEQLNFMNLRIQRDLKRMTVKSRTD